LFLKIGISIISECNYGFTYTYEKDMREPVKVKKKELRKNKK
jgi:hypothetical protein